MAATGFLLDNDAANDSAPDLAGSQSLGAGATTTLTTFGPVTPGETITLRLVLFDEGDDQLDSLVLVDNFRWGTDALGAPITQQ